MADVNSEQYGFTEEPESNDFGFTEEEQLVSDKKQSVQDMLMDYMKQSASTFENTALGAGDAVNNLLRGTSNMVMPQSMQVPMMQSGSGTGYGLGTALGDIAGFAGGGEALDTARVASEAVPYIGKAAEWLGGDGSQALAKRMIGSGTYGAIQNPDDRLKGALEAASLSGTFDAVPVIGSEISESVTPKKYMNTVFQTISDQLGKSKRESSSMYGDIMKKYGSQPIDASGLNPEVFNTQSGLKKLHDEFKENPTLENAHRLQSQLGSSDRALKAKDVSTWDRKNDYQDARQTLLNSISNSLGQNSPEAKQAYSNAAQHYRDRVLPFQMTSDALQKMVRPTPEALDTKLEAITKKDLYPSTRIGEIRTPNVPPEIADLQHALSKKISNRNIAQILGGAAFGGTAAHSLGIPIGAEIGTALGAYGGKKLGSAFNSKSGSSSLSSAIANALAKLYKGGSKATIATLLGGQ
jgi:hypothetical protein